MLLFWLWIPPTKVVFLTWEKAVNEHNTKPVSVAEKKS